MAMQLPLIKMRVESLPLHMQMCVISLVLSRLPDEAYFDPIKAAHPICKRTRAPSLLLFNN